MKSGFEMKYSQMAGGFSPTLQKLARLPLPVKTAYAVKKIADAIHSEQKRMREAFNKEILEPLAKKNEKGELIKDETGDVQIDDAKKEEFEAAQKAFGERSFRIDRYKLKLDLFESINLSASELSALDPIIEDPEEAPEAEVVAIRK